MRTHRFKSVGDELKFFGSNVRGTLLGGFGVGVGVWVRVDVEVGSVAFVAGTVVGISRVGAAVTFVPPHAEASAQMHTPDRIDVATNRFPSTRTC